MTLRTRNPLAGGLIKVAEELTKLRGRGIVQQAAFRRAISSTSYALFHSLCQVCAEALGVWTSANADLEAVYRHLDHARSKDVLTSARARALHPDLPRIADAFIELRRLREDADYSPSGRLGAERKPLTRTETQHLIAYGREAVELLDRLPADPRRSLAILLMVRPARR